MSDSKNLIGKRVILRGKRNHRFNGRLGTVVAVEMHGKRKDIEYLRVERIEDLHPNSSHLYKPDQVEVVA